MPSAEPEVRRTVYYEGRVQGVGFRYTTTNIAQSFRVKGMVRNLDDGRVHLIAEGAPAELARFLDAVSSTMSRYIRNTQVTESPATGEFPAFTVERTG